MTNSPPRVTGLDLSLTSTGAAVICGAAVGLTRIQPPDGYGDHQRIDWVRHHVWGLTRPGEVDLVVIEGPSYGSVTGKQHERAGLWWIIARMLWRASIPYAVVAPSTLKKYATGSGSAKTGKDKVLAAAVRRYPMADVDGHDVADGLILAAMGAHHLGHPLAPVPATHAAALQSVRWPDLKGNPAP